MIDDYGTWRANIRWQKLKRSWKADGNFFCLLRTTEHEVLGFVCFKNKRRIAHVSTVFGCFAKS
jgi:hypothetical protein